MAGFEGDGEEGYFFFVVYEVGGEHDVGEVVVFGEAVDVFVYQVCVHQAEGGVGIRDFYSEDQAEENADCVFYEFSGFSVASDFAVPDDGIVGVSFFPEGFKFVGVGLAVGVGLEDIVSLVFNGVAVTVENGGTVATVWFGQRDQERAGLCQFADQLICMIFASIVNDNQTGLSLFVVRLYDGIPFTDCAFYVFCLVVCGNYDK